MGGLNTGAVAARIPTVPQAETPWLREQSGDQATSPRSTLAESPLGGDGWAVLRSAALRSGPMLCTAQSQMGASVPTNPQLPSIRIHDGREQKEAPRLQGAPALAWQLPGGTRATTAH